MACPAVTVARGASEWDWPSREAGCSLRTPAFKSPPTFPTGVSTMVTLTVNGEPRQVNADPAMPILWALRDLLGLKGAKYGCGMGLCGSCTVHLDGEPIRACITPISTAEGKAITTIEGLSPDGTHPLQTAWAELNVPQCGYCQPGQIMSAAALLNRKADPSDEEIDAAMAGNICRCGTYQRVRAAIHRAAGSAATHGGA